LPFSSHSGDVLLPAVITGGVLYITAIFVRKTVRLSEYHGFFSRWLEKPVKPEIRRGYILINLSISLCITISSLLILAVIVDRIPYDAVVILSLFAVPVMVYTIVHALVKRLYAFYRKAVNRNASSVFIEEYFPYYEKKFRYTIVQVCAAVIKIINPSGRDAQSVRAFSLVMLVPVFAIITASFFPGSIPVNARIWLFLITIYTFILVYISNSSEPTGLSVKLISVTLVTMLLIITIMSELYGSRLKTDFFENQIEEVTTSRLALETGNPGLMPAHVAYLAFRPEKRGLYSDRYEKLYARDAGFDISSIIESESIMMEKSMEERMRNARVAYERSGIDIDDDSLRNRVMKEIETDTLTTMNRYSRWTRYSEDVSQKAEYFIYYFEHDGGFAEAGFAYSDYEDRMKSTYIFFYIILGAFGFIVLIFPLFFRASLLNPMNTLLRGVQEVDKGNYEVRLPVKAEDEIGIISRTFNKMVASIKAADQLKDEFLANTSHELRTPLNGILGIVESIVDDSSLKLPEKTRSHLALVMSSGKRLGNLVNDILDFTQIKNKDIVLNRKPVDMRQIAEIVLTISEPLTAEKNIELLNNIGENIPAVFGDENRLQQIMYNLVGNAIKFTESGRVETDARALDGDLEITVADTGIGIPEDKFEKIFQSFEQVDASTVREYTGAGLGLSITRQLIELHGGTIRVESEVGRGSRFIFTVPVSKEKPEKRAAAARNVARVREVGKPLPIESPKEFSAGSDIKILVVDDEPINLQVLSSQLSQYNYEIVLADSGSKALSIIEKGPRPDLIVLDIMMPKMSGYEVSRKLREKYSSSELPIIMVTAKNQVSDLVKGLTSGANDYISKPVSRDELLARIKMHLNLTKISSAYARFVPDKFLEFLGKESIVDVRLGENVQKIMTILFSDIRSFTSLSEKMTPEENFKFLNSYLKRVGPIIRQHNGFIDKYIGDAIMALFPEKVDNALEAAIDTRKEIVRYNTHRRSQGYSPIDIGTGIHTGKLMLGTIGEKLRMEGTVISDAVNLASRIEGLTKIYGASIIISEQTLAQLKDASRYNYRCIGRIQVKGKDESVGVYDMFDGDQENVMEMKITTKSDFEEGLKLYHDKKFAEASVRFSTVSEKNPADKAAQLYLKRCAQFMVQGVPSDWMGVETMEKK